MFKLHLADTSIKLFRKKDNSVSVKLKSFLMVNDNGLNFSIDNFNVNECCLRLADGKKIEMKVKEYLATCCQAMGYRYHEIWFSGQTEMDILKDTIGIFSIEYRLFSPEIYKLEYVVPVLARGNKL